MSEALRAAVALAEEMERLAWASSAENIVVGLRKRVTMLAKLSLACVELKNENARLRTENEALLRALTFGAERRLA